ncbi:MAG: hypothetical protein JXK07_00045 [Spirochaetes bacterium]|nr:hypothetical protein [Spirochaetota bacterium]MBN2769596.1 hypothetical protein [Spirochaetota bacterium]
MRSVMLLCITALILASCKQNGALSHEELFLNLRSTYHKGDIQNFKQLILSSDKEFISRKATRINKLSKAAKNELAENFKIDVNLINFKSIDDYLRFYFILSKTSNRDILSSAINCNIALIEADERSAKYYMTNGINLYFTKEERYWKFCYEKSLNGN